MAQKNGANVCVKQILLRCYITIPKDLFGNNYYTGAYRLARTDSLLQHYKVLAKFENKLIPQEFQTIATKPQI